MEHTLNTVGGMIGGAIGNGIQTGCDGYETYEDIHNHNYSGAILEGTETVYHGVNTVVDAVDGDWLF